jgi:hypothetical protein
MPSGSTIVMRVFAVFIFAAAAIAQATVVAKQQVTAQRWK